MTYNTINAELGQLLYSHANSVSIDVAWPNMAFDPTGAAFFRPSLLPRSADTPFYGATLDQGGIYQIDVNVPKGSNMAQARTLVDGLLTAFNRGTKSGILLIEKSEAGPEIAQDSAWLTIPVSVYYRVFD